MSGVAIVRQLLAEYAPVLAIAPAARIHVGVLPQGITLPAISVRSISQNEEATVARNSPWKMIRERVQVTIYTQEDYVAMSQLLKASALGPGVHKGIVVGFNVKSVLPWGVNPEIPPGDDKIYEQSRDFMVTFVEAN